MSTCPTDSAVYQEEIKTIVFRQDDGITIPKSVREAAFELSIDVIVRSITKEPYKNYECSPPESFYGNATLVFQDCLELKVPLKFPRQRIYYGRVPEAFEQWNALINFEYHRSAYLDLICGTIVNLGIALGFEVGLPTECCSLPQPTWRELPIREAYVNVAPGTQYEIEISWLYPVAFSDFCGTFYEGLSGQTDGDKDAGLPPNGIDPNIAENPSNPFAGLPNATSDFEQGGFSNSKSANLGDRDPANEPQIPHSCSGGVCAPNPAGIYPSLSACEAAIIRGGNWKVSYDYYDPSAGCAVTRYTDSYTALTNPNDVLTYTDVVATTSSCVGTGATQGNFRRNGAIFSSPSSLSNVEFFFDTINTCP